MNLFNATTGFNNLILICGFVGIYISKDKSKTMIWPDMIMWWIIVFELWNFTYMYNVIRDWAFYSLAPLLAATYAAYALRKGAWMQHRAFTLAINELILFAIPNAFVYSDSAVGFAWNPYALWTLRLISFAVNVALLIYQVKIIVTKKKSNYWRSIYRY